MILFSHTITPRLQYITRFITKELTGNEANVTSSIDEFKKYGSLKINYSDEKITGDEFWIKPHGLLFQNTIEEQKPVCFEVNGYKAFFKTGGDFPFDIFAASFYLLSRYEEYLPHQKDDYGRYAYQNSLAYKEKFLNQPLINIWLEQLKSVLKDKNPEAGISNPDFIFLPTYDIDMAWSYKHKGWWRNLGGAVKSFFKADFKRLKERIWVTAGKRKDPFDAYGWMNGLHEKYKLRPYYFFLLAEKNGKYDKNISPQLKVMKDLVYDHAIRYPVGIHPSWQSGDDPSLVKKEMATLSGYTGSAVQSSRQHYIRFTFPETFRILLNSGIRFDFSMGYGSINGFRASAASPFYWYDLPNEQQTELLLFPFCFMDANAFYEQRLTPQQALEEMRNYYKVIKSVNGTFIMIWHNTFLGADKVFAGWKETYEQFIKEISL